jgi:hypothetical protein
MDVWLLPKVPYKGQGKAGLEGSYCAPTGSEAFEVGI